MTPGPYLEPPPRLPPNHLLLPQPFALTNELQETRRPLVPHHAGNPKVQLPGQLARQHVPLLDQLVWMLQKARHASFVLVG